MSTPDIAQLLRELTEDVVPEDAGDALEARVLDATLRLTGEYGERRLTVDDVAAASRVARATIFRRFGSKDALIGRLYMRELRRAAAVVRAADDDLTAGFVALVEHTCEHPIIRRLSRVEPDRLVELWRDGLDLVRAMFTRLGADPPLADALSRMLFSYMLLPDDRPADDGLRDLAQALIAVHA